MQESWRDLSKPTGIEVEENVRDILGHPRNRGKFVQHILNPYLRDGSTGQRRQQYAPDRIA